MVDLVSSEPSDDEIIWVSEQSDRPKRLLLQRKNGLVRLLSLVDGDECYTEIMPARGIGTMAQLADRVLCGRDMRLPTTLTKTILAASVIKLFLRMRSLEKQLSDLNEQSTKQDAILEAAE